ncbi:putative nucleic acid-binding protein, contains PIN domain [Terriglobus roseus DSM 18391]|uniref:Ribonuclease VapC n=1 Tax=Terriglobus roseus (strain DSM 18391 / NRRL B-41598 / KBS 63) TaxID=926566 RepID=I3ZLD3_TERRK|nr:type II toxin-antitoxin system VapC family toxin [Terriglobus roseus]AFL90051.1 putative nucleic acid-binding protein, contains PIN domain [Terriglobus roseus DSM 18391]
MKPGALFDTNILIDLSRGHAEASLEVSQHDQRFISRINFIEVLAGVVEQNARETRRLLDLFATFDLSIQIAERAALLRRTTRLKLPDAIIYATALEHDLTLVTRNTKDFSETMPNVRIPYLL